jgi:hypothetical protein
MKKVIIAIVGVFVLAFIISASVANAQVPASSQTYTWNQLKSAAKGDTAATSLIDSTAAAEAIKFASSAAYGKEALLKGCTITAVWTITGVKSRSGRTEDQELITFTDANGDTKYALVVKGKTEISGSDVKTYHGDQKVSKYK